MSRYMDSYHTGRCGAKVCIAPSRKIRKGEPIFWNDQARIASHAECHRSNVKFDQVLNAIANVSPVVCDLGDDDVNHKYAAAYNLLSSVFHDGAVKGITPEFVKEVLDSDVKDLMDSAIEATRPKMDLKVIREAANLMMRAGLPVYTEGMGYAECLEVQLEPWELRLPSEKHAKLVEKHQVTIYFANTWGGDDGYTSFYRIYCTHDVRGIRTADREQKYHHTYVLDQWARDAVKDAGVNPCSIDSDVKELVGFVIEAIGAIRSHGAVDGIPCEDRTADDLVPARGAKCTPKYERCTSDDPTDHQGDTCPVHEADTVSFDIIRQSLDVIRKRTGSERVQREADVIEAQLHQIEMQR